MKKTSAISMEIGIFQFRLLRSVSKAFSVSQLTQRSDRSLRIFGCHKTYMCSLGTGFANSPIATFIGMACVVEQKKAKLGSTVRRAFSRISLSNWNRRFVYLFDLFNWIIESLI